MKYEVGDPGTLEAGTNLVEAFTGADWAGDKSSETRKLHSVSSAMVYVNNRLVSSWSRTQKSIALSSCESEYLSAVSGGAEALYVSRLWSFLVEKEVQAKISCRAFSQRQGVGRLKHVETKYLWLQQQIKSGSLEMDGVATVLNISDLGTKKLTKVRRCFLMYLIGLVEFDPSTKSYVPAGEDEFNLFMQKSNGPEHEADSPGGSQHVGGWIFGISSSCGEAFGESAYNSFAAIRGGWLAN